MHDQKKESKAMSLTVTEGLTVTILPDSNHEFLMPTKEVAIGYGTSDYAIRKAFLRNESELIHGKHFLKGLDILSNPQKNLQPHQVFWTKRGVVRLGFFIKSDRAKMFRDWAEELVLQKIEPSNVERFYNKLEGKKRNHNRLTQERLLSIMADVCKIDDRDLRLSISGKLMNGGL